MAQSDPVIDLTLDYHAHILPRCDHGSDGVETSLRQLAMAAEAGIRTVCATPHFYPHRENAAAFLERRARCAAALPRRPELPRILLGAEVLICDGMERPSPPVSGGDERAAAGNAVLRVAVVPVGYAVCPV